jgi:hypothetical protein
MKNISIHPGLTRAKIIVKLNWLANLFSTGIPAK